jgi:hypothetical protein
MGKVERTMVPVSLEADSEFPTVADEFGTL